MARIRYVPRRSGIQEILADSSLDPVLLANAEKVAARARSTAPVETGEYRDSIQARVTPGRSRRRAAEAIATAPHALVVESRTRNMGGAVG